MLISRSMSSGIGNMVAMSKVENFYPWTSMLLLALEDLVVGSAHDYIELKFENSFVQEVDSMGSVAIRLLDPLE